MLVTMKELLHDARKNSYAIGAFNVPSLEAISAVMAAAEEGGYPVILQHAEVHENYVSLDVIGPIMLDFAKKSSVPTAVHFDHGASFDMCVRAMRLGFTSVMYDASAKPFDINVRESAEIVKIAHALGVSVEAELGHVFTSAIGGGEGRGPVGAEDYESLEDCYTNPDDAKKFVEETNVDALAIAFGTTHGVYLSKPTLNLDRISEINAKTALPLVMHGGSGVSDEDYRTAIKNGITKINYYTYMTLAGAEAVADYVKKTKEGDKMFFHDMSRIATEAMKENVNAAMKTFSMK